MLWNSQFHCCCQKSTPNILSQMNTVHRLTKYPAYFIWIHFSVVLFSYRLWFCSICISQPKLLSQNSKLIGLYYWIFKMYLSSSSSSSSLTWQLFMSHSLPWISWQQDFYRLGMSTPRPTPNRDDQTSVFVTSRDRVPSYTPRHCVPILVVFYYTHELCWDYSYPAVTKRRKCIYSFIKWQMSLAF
jgi:hypothetical protein